MNLEEITDQEAERIIQDPMADPQPGDAPATRERKSSTESEGAGKKKKLFASVVKPERIGDGVNAYVQYTVKSKAEDGSDVDRVRRYSDFDWLHDILRQEFPSTMIPPLPEKAFINRFSPEFLELRRKGLDRFLSRVLNHPLLSTSPDVKIFLTGTEQEIQIARQRAIPTAQAKKEPEEKKGFFASLSNTISNVSANLTTTVSAVAGPDLQEIDPWFASYNDYINNLDQHLQVLQQRASINSKKKQEFMSTLTDFAHASSLLSATETGHDDVLAEGWGKMSEVTGQMATVQGELVQAEVDGFEDSIRDYILLVRAAREVMENRANSLLKLQSLGAEVKAKQEKLSKNTSASKTAALTTELQQAKDAEEQHKAQFETLSKEVKEELEKFREKKGKDLRKSMSELVRQNMNAQLRVVGLWKEILAELEEHKKQLS